MLVVVIVFYCQANIYYLAVVVPSNLKPIRSSSHQATFHPPCHIQLGQLIWFFLDVKLMCQGKLLAVKQNQMIWPTGYFPVLGPTHLLFLDVKLRCQGGLLDVKDLSFTSNIVLSLMLKQFLSSYIGQALGL